MNYIDDIADRIGARCEMPFSPDYRSSNRLLRTYAVLCLVKGGDTTSRDVHDAWSAWRSETEPDHRSLVPFEQLAPDVQALDDKYRDAILAVADELDGIDPADVMAEGEQ
jgi:hypothetical protein